MITDFDAKHTAHELTLDEFRADILALELEKDTEGLLSEIEKGGAL
jgi:hypothetical protein